MKLNHSLRFPRYRWSFENGSTVKTEFTDSSLSGNAYLANADNIPQLNDDIFCDKCRKVLSCDSNTAFYKTGDQKARLWD